MEGTTQPTVEQLAEKEAEIAKLQAVVESQQKELGEKDKTIAETQKQLDAKTSEVKEAEGLITGLQNALSKQESAESSLDSIVTHKGKKYRVVVPFFKFKGQQYKAEELNGHKDIIAILVEKKSSVLVAL